MAKSTIEEKEFSKSLVFPFTPISGFKRGKPAFLHIYKTFKAFRDNLRRYRTNYVYVGSGGDPVWRFFNTLAGKCPIKVHDCMNCPFQVGSLLYLGSRGAAACLLFQFLDYSYHSGTVTDCPRRAVPINKLLAHTENLVTRAEKYAKERGWS